jgi:hypothetical protein
MAIVFLQEHPVPTVRPAIVGDGQQAHFAVDALHRWLPGCSITSTHTVQFILTMAVSPGIVCLTPTALTPCHTSAASGKDSTGTYCVSPPNTSLFGLSCEVASW